MLVADRDVDELGREVEVPVPVVIPEVAALGAGDRDRVERVLHRPRVEDVPLRVGLDLLAELAVPLDRHHGARLTNMTETVDAPAVTRIPHWIGGRRVESGSGRSGPVYNPATGRQTGAVDFATVEEVDAAVQAAREAFPAWRATSLAKRAELFFRIRELLHARREEVAEILTASTARSSPTRSAR